MATKFIAKAIKRPGALRKELGAKDGEPIPEGKLDEAAKKDGKVGQRARFAKVLKGFHHNQHSNLRMNMGGGKIRHDTLHGRDHIVVPMVMMTVGVHNGSAGPLLYPKDELSKNPDQWNHMPIVVYHPEANGKGVSARDPDVLNTRGVGMVLNSAWDDKLKSEAWIDVDRITAVDKRVIDALEAGKMVEISTGVFTDNEEATGEWNGEKYVAIARNHRPDHLAILPDQKGACSIADGAGLNRNAATMEYTHEHKRKLLEKALRERHGSGMGMYSPQYPEDMSSDRVFYTGKDGDLCHEGYEIDDKGTQATLKGDAKKVTRKVQYVGDGGKVVANSEDWRLDAPTDEVEDTKVNKEQARLALKPGITNTKENSTMNKVQIIAALIANAAGLWTDSDKEYLEKQNIEKLQRHYDALPTVEEDEVPEANKELDVGSGEVENDGNKTGVKGKGKPAPKKKKLADAEGVTGLAAKKNPFADAEDEKDGGADEDEEDADGKVKKNSEKTIEEVLADVPDKFREVLRHGVRQVEVQRAKLIKTITSNANNTFPLPVLKSKSIDELQALATLASPAKQRPVANFSGLGWGESGAGYASGTVTPLPVPVMNFAPPAAQ